MLYYMSVAGISVGDQSTLGARHFSPKICARKINKMPEFYVIFVHKINKIPEFYMIYARKINKIPEFYMIFARKIYFSQIGGSAPPAPVSYAYVRFIEQTRPSMME